MAKPIRDNALHMVLKRPVGQGQQIFTSFGPRSNDHLFFHYGMPSVHGSFMPSAVLPLCNLKCLRSCMKLSMILGANRFRSADSPRRADPLSEPASFRVNAWKLQHALVAPQALNNNLPGACFKAMCVALDFLDCMQDFFWTTIPSTLLAIFRSFQDAAKWFLDGLENDCDTQFLELSTSGDTRPLNITAKCPRVKWEKVLAAAKSASDSATSAEGLEQESQDWWDLVKEWGDLGYEYLPYRPGPDVRPGGVVDPALLSVFSATLKLWNSSLPAWRFPACATQPEVGHQLKGAASVGQALRP